MKHYFVFLCLGLVACSEQQPPETSNPLSSAPSTQCAKDTDCKGDRICESGLCQAPGGTRSPISAQGLAASPQEEGQPPMPETALTTGNPKFKDYAVDVYEGPASKLDLSSEDARNFKTRLREAMEREPDFAGEYNLATWGCGSSGCINQYFVSRKTGKVLEDAFGSFSAFGITDEAGEDVRFGSTIEGMKPTSRLLVVRDQADPNEEDGVYDIEAVASFYVVENEKLKLIKTVPLPKPVIKELSYE